MKKMMKYLLIMCIVALVYTVWVEPNWLIVKNFEMLPENDNKVRVVQFTDTQLGDFYSLEQFKAAIKKINEMEPDIILFTGDLIDRANDYDDIEAVGELLQTLKAPLGKFAVWGNHDYGGGGHKYYAEVLENGGFQLLVNEVHQIDAEGKKLAVIGADDGLYGEEKAQNLISGLDENAYNILMIHEPDLMDNYLEGNVDLALAGHSHGGQVALPFIGAIVKVPLGEKYTKGFYDFENERKSKLFVSSGLGSTKLPFRLCNRPEIIVFDI